MIRSKYTFLFTSSLFIAPWALSALTISSTFDSGLDGWTKAPGSDTGSSLAWVSTGGNPGGFIRHTEAAQGQTDFIAAPAKFLGNKSAYVGGTFSLDRLTNTLSNPLTSTNDVIFTGGGISLRFDLPNPGLNTWVTEEITLLAGAGWLRVSDSQAPTAAQFAAVMADLTEIRLLADFRSGPETPSYDNIFMVIPEPASAGLAMGAMALALGLRRRTRR